MIRRINQFNIINKNYLWFIKPYGKMKKIIKTLLFFLALQMLAPYFAKAGKPGVPTLANSKSALNGPDLVFRENKGQLMDANHEPMADIPFYGKQGGVSVNCRQGMLSFVFEKADNDVKVSEATGKLSESGFSGLQNKAELKRKEGLNKKAIDDKLLTINRAELQFLNANLNAEITASDEQEYYENYYTTGDANHGITNVHTYKTITYKAIYPHIDLVLEAKAHGMEYSFIVYPGGKVADIQLQWNGLGDMKELGNGGIAYALPVGATGWSPNNGFAIEKQGDRPVAPTFTESAPVCYQTGTEDYLFFQKNGNLKSPSPINSKLKIKKSRPNGMAGRATLFFSVPHYDKTKTLVIDPVLDWGTYFGGDGNDLGNGVAHDANSNVYLIGITESDHGIATSGSYQSSFGGAVYPYYDHDAFLAKFDSSGNLNWATYYGGIGDVYGYGIAIDTSGYLYITGYTNHNGKIATKGAWQTKYGGGNDDAFLAKFNSAGGLTWASYFGGKNTETGNGIAIDPSGNVYIAGQTYSDSGIATSGAYQTFYAGGSDAFLAKFDSAGSQKWATYFGGTNIDQVTCAATDASGNIYITGVSYSDSGVATTGAYQTKGDSASGDAFLAKFDGTGALLWATYYGGSDNDEGYGVATDHAGSVYITGLTYSESNIATAGAYQTFYGGDYSGFLAKFSASGNIKWATYYGGSGIDYGTGVATDIIGNVYIVGTTTSASLIATAGAFQTFCSGACDIFLAKFNSPGNLEWATYYGGTDYDYSSGITINATGNAFITGWTGSASGIASSGAFKTINSGGYYDAFLAKFNFHLYNTDAGLPSVYSPQTTGCVGIQDVKVVLKNYGNDTLKSDSIYWEINGAPQKSIKWTGSLEYDSFSVIKLGSYNFIEGYDTIIAWCAHPNGVTDSAAYNDTLKNVITINPLPPANAGANKYICLGENASIGSKAISGNTYSWASRPAGYTSTRSNPSVSPTLTSTYILTEKVSATGCKNSDSVIIAINPLPKATWTTIISNMTANFTPNDTTAKTYLWHFGNGDSSYLQTPIDTYKTDTTYKVSLLVTSDSGCTAEYDSNINIITTTSITNLGVNIFSLLTSPNPFTTNLSVSYTLPENQNVQLTLTDITGKKIATLINEKESAGAHSYILDANKYNLPAGTYILHMVAGGEAAEVKVIKVKNEK